MWILLNNKPTNIFDIREVSGIMERTKDPKAFGFFFYLKNDTEFYWFSTKEKAEEVRDNLLKTINQVVASLPRIDIKSEVDVYKSINLKL